MHRSSETEHLHNAQQEGERGRWLVSAGGLWHEPSQAAIIQEGVAAADYFLYTVNIDD